MYLIPVIAGLIIVAIIYWYILFHRYFVGLLTVPKAPMVPIFGSLVYLKNITEVYWDLNRWTITMGKSKLLRVVLGYHFCLNIADPEVLEYIMTHTSVINKATLNKFLHNWLGTGLLTSGGDKWRNRRKLLTPAYHFKILSQFVDIFDKNSTILVEKLQIENGSQGIDIYPYMSLFALDTICETAMGTTINAQQNETSDLVHATKELKRIILARSVSLLKQIDLTYRFTQDYRIEKQCLEIIHNYTMSVINSRREALLNDKQFLNDEDVSDKDHEIGFKKRIPFLDLLLQTSQNGMQLSNEDINEEVNTFMFEGHDTVSAAISFAIYLIAKYRDVQKNLIKEQRDIYKSDIMRATTLSDLNEMKYLDMTIKETLRLCPTIPFTGRTVTEDFSYGNCTFSKGLQIGLGIYTLHHNPDIYPEPEKFDPERFTPENQAKRHPFSYLPFSAGFRNCVGQKFAMLEMKTAISKLLRNFEFFEDSNHKLQLKSELVLNSATGIVVKIKARKW